MQSDGQARDGALAAAIAWAEAAYHACDVCPENCKVDRHAGPAGVCGLGADARIYKEYLHYGEEARLVPSHTVYLTGCNFRCAFCSDWDQITAPLAHGVVVAPEVLAARIRARVKQGAKNVNFVGGLPDVNVLWLLKVMALVPEVPVVWNTNLWSAPALIEHLSPLVDTWLVDLKFGNDGCAKKLARIDRYWETLTANLLRLPRSRILVRHLLMPNHFECCTRPVLEWLAATMPEVPTNLMTGYHPFRLARSPSSPLAHTMPTGEVSAALALFRSLPLGDRMVDGL